MIKQFKLYFKMNFLKEIQYRAATLSGLLTQLFFGLMFILIYVAFYESNSAPSDFGIREMSTYIWLQQAFFMMFKYYDNNKYISKQIVNGDIAYQMLKPINLYDQWFYDYYTSNFSRMLLRSVGIFTVCGFLPYSIAMTLPVSLNAFLVFLLSLILGSVLVTTINMFSYILVTITFSPSAVFGIVNTLASLFAGAIIPIPLMPKFFANILNYLPFRYASDLPFRIYIGNIAVADAWSQIAIQVFWLVILLVTGRIFLTSRLKKFVVQGG